VKTCTDCKEYLPLTSFNKKLKNKNVLRAICKKCSRKHQVTYSNTEKGFITNLFNGIKSKVNKTRYKKFSEEEKNKHRCHVTKEKFIELFEKHKKIFGYTCALTGVPVVLKVTNHSESNKSNTLSVDRLNPEIGYTEKNIIFVSSKANQMKNAVTKDLCIAILKAYEERGL